MITGAEYLAAVRFALRHLYDPNALRLSPLLALGSFAQRVDPLGSLRQTLISTIEGLEPSPETPVHSRLWRIYEILLYRFVQQCAQEEVADQLGISVRHLRREEREAIEVLAHRLAERLKLAVDWAAVPASAPPEEDDAEETPAIAQELAWVQTAAPGAPVALERLLGAVSELLQPLAERHRVRLEVTPPAAPLRLGGQEVVLRQILILVLTGAIRQAGGGTVQVAAHGEGPYVRITIRGLPPAQGRSPASNEDNLAMAHQLVGLCGGRLELTSSEGAFLAVLHLPTSEQVPVLAIDDNEDTLRLLARYTADTRYRLIGARTVEQAFALAQETAPQLILLDVMMPGVDGWELLGRLSQHPATARIPIIVCTILAQEELALSLGAAGFLHKPVSRQELLEALNRYLQPTQPA